MKFAARARQLEFKPLDRVFDRVIVCFAGSHSLTVVAPFGAASVSERIHG